MTTDPISPLDAAPTHTMTLPKPEGFTLGDSDDHDLEESLYLEKVYVSIDRGPEGYYWSFFSPSFGQKTIEPKEHRNVFFYMSDKCKTQFTLLQNGKHKLKEKWIRGHRLFSHVYSCKSAPIGGKYEVMDAAQGTEGRELSIFINKITEIITPKVKIYVCPESQFEKVARSETDKVSAKKNPSATPRTDADTFLLLDRANLGYSNKSHSISLPAEGKVELSFASDQYVFSNLVWNTPDQKCPSWIDCSFKEGVTTKRFTIENTNTTDDHPYWASFDFDFDCLNSGQLYRARFTSDPTIVHRGSANPENPPSRCEEIHQLEAAGQTGVSG